MLFLSYLAIVLSVPDNAPYIEHFARRKAFAGWSYSEQKQRNITQVILTSTYTSSTFPLLEENGIFLFYITAEMRKSYPPEQGLFFLFKNEKFKLLHSQKGAEVWQYKKE